MQICFYTNNNTLKETVQWRLCKRYKRFLTCNLKFFKWKFALLMHNLQKILFFHRSNWFHIFNLWFRALYFRLMVLLFHDSVPLRSIQKSNPSDMKQKQNKEKRDRTLRRQTIYEPVAYDFLSRFFSWEQPSSRTLIVSANISSTKVSPISMRCSIFEFLLYRWVKLLSINAAAGLF